MYIVTGGAGFIGSNLVRGLVARGHRVLVVDDMANRDKVATNLGGVPVVDCLDKEFFREAVAAGRTFGSVEGLFHQGACADTLCTDRWRLWWDNYEYSTLMLRWALVQRIPLVYASSAAVYGAATSFTEEPDNERPLNFYGWSKLLFDRYVRLHARGPGSTVVGLRYFNVYGPGEAHKGRMASTAYQVYRQVRRSGVARLFEGTGGFARGQQQRDFVHVSDVVAVNLHFMQSAPRRGIYNVGTGAARTFNDLARAVTREVGTGSIVYVPVPKPLRDTYQSFTEADLTELRRAGYDGDFASLEVGVADAVARWNKEPADSAA
ncbi:MAG: ADP-glyceromanno-heptose 6-epimerase [Planctomycetes bacterium]|nr:ADP-glyceromanno-heptose 6-epimerase [Planctomycetota bacterium]